MTTQIDKKPYIYAGIGSRKAPKAVLAKMWNIARMNAQLGRHLATGGAPGMDDISIKGHKSITNSNLTIYIPWPGFQSYATEDQNVRDFQGYATKDQSVYIGVTDKAIELTRKYHPRWSTLTPGVQKLMARNAYQILGLDLKTPVNCVICWTPGGKLIGGTAQAIKIAMDYNIPVFNIASDKVLNTCVRALTLSVKALENK
jgi:hypothetical protein